MPVPPEPEPTPASERPGVEDLLRRHPELAPPVADVPDPPRWKGRLSFTILLLVALGGAALAADVASGAAIVGSGLGGQRVTLVDVGGLRNTTGTVAAPAALAGRHVDVIGGSHGAGTYHLWPHGVSSAYERGWGFLAGVWIPVVVMVLCLIAVGVIGRVLVKLVRGRPV